jgi:dTDP-4-amino-4,6-dideoxy-D-galactose acyltransferase
MNSVAAGSQTTTNSERQPLNSAISNLSGTPALVRRDWECEHFGFSVAQISQANLNDAELVETLRLARDGGIRLAVWPTTETREVPGEITTEFAGALVDRKATFTRSLGASPATETVDETTDQHCPGVFPYTASAPSSALIGLAIAAGKFSRFRVDPAFPQEKFLAMYRLWIERSVRGELADMVLVAAADLIDNPERVELDPAGMVTLAESGGVGQIGLIAVAGAMRGRGIGSALITAAHRWMQARGAVKTQVVTQLANLPACRLYERAGYQLARVQNFYHFWLS